MKIGILYICTGKYKIFWKDFYLSCEKYFIPQAEKEYFVFTDNEEIDFEKENPRIHKRFQKNLGWPGNTLRRYEVFLKIKEDLARFEYLFFFNANLQFLQEITTEEFLPVGQEKLVACLHPGYFNKKRKKFTYEKNPRSTAFINKDKGKNYFAGGINGGKTTNFIEAVEIMSENIKLDQKNNIIAIWHDESHWNKYLSERNDIKILSPSYLYPEASKLPFDKKIMIRDKRKYFDYSNIGKSKSLTIFSNIKNFIKNNYIVRNSFLWFFVGKWFRRIKLIFTVYRNEKKTALKSYLANDFEYFKIKKYIKSFKKGKNYNFGGIILPKEAVTIDNFLNVLLPHVKNIIYEPQNINDLYLKQSQKYKTLFYWKNKIDSREPDYIESHLLSHGFTYFFKEINIEKGDVVFDIGSAPGDFSALAAFKGAEKIYSFEPGQEYKFLMEKVNKLNGNKIILISKFCGLVNNEDNIVLDSFVKNNKIEWVDFIKMDIEGTEESVLKGSKDILKNFKPKLAICTYHNFEDSEKIKKAILEANSAYTIYEEKGIIYAY